MKNLKKVLALVLAFSMMLSVVAFASYNDVDADADYAGAVELLSALDIIKGDDLGNFNPDNTITRAEFAAIVCRAKGLENAAEGAKGATAFVDVAADHWAAGYINLATQNGIINGYGDGNFGPEDKVTYEQAVKMLVCALGFEPMAANKGGYPTGYLVVANQYGITKGVKATVEAPRKTVAQLVYNALTTPMMDQTSYGTDASWEVLDGKKDREYKTLLTDIDVYIATGVVGAKISGEDKVTFELKESSDDFEFGYAPDGVKTSDGYNKVYAADNGPDLFISESNIQDYKNQYVDAYVLKENGKYYVLAVVPSTMGESLVINSDDIDYKNSEDGTIQYFVDNKNTKKIKLDKDGVNIELNEAVESKKYTSLKAIGQKLGFVDDDGAFIDDADVQLTFIENTGDSYYDTIVALSYVSSRVKSVEADRDRLEVTAGTIKFVFDDDSIQYVIVDENGNALSLEDFAEDDVVAYYTDNDNKLRSFNYIKVIKLTTAAVTGTVDEISTDGKTVWINNVEYDLANGVDLENEDEGTFYIGMTGKIVDFEGTSAKGNYAYVLEAGESKSSFSTTWEVKLLTAKDGVVSYTLTGDANEKFTSKITDAKDLTVTTERLGITGTQQLFKDVKDKANAYRFVTFKTNSAGKIKTLERAEGTINAIKANSEYKVATQKISGMSIEDDAVIYNIDANVDSVYTTDISALVDEGVYGGFGFKDEDGEYVALVITDDAGQLSDDAGFAVVTKVKLGKNDGEDIVTVNYVQDGEEGTVIFNDDSDIIKNTASVDPSDLGVGDVIMFTASADGIVNKYAVLGQINNSGLLSLNDATLKQFSEDNTFYYGYIANTKRDSKTKGENLELVAGAKNAIEITVGSAANKYTYNDANKRNIEIVEGDFMGGNDTDYYTVDDNNKAEATMVFVRVVDDEVVDIYSFNARVKVKDDGKVNGATTAVITGGKSQATVNTYNAAPIVEEVVAPVEEDAVVEDVDAEIADID